MSYWNNKVAIVTGASSGLGRSLAAALAQSGARVVLAARGREKLDEAAADLASRGAKILAIPTDITRQADVDMLIARTLAEFGQVDVLANCAGRSQRGEALATTPEEFASLLELNFLALVRCTRAAAEHLIKQQGHVINIGSLAAKVAPRYMGAYAATKFAVAAYSQQLRLELADKGLHVLLACPGPIARAEQRDYSSAGTASLPDRAMQPGGGAKVSSLTPERVSQAILRACEHRRLELVMPAKARLLFMLAGLSPRLGDWLLTKMT